MAFQDIFNFARSLSGGGSTAEEQLSGFIPKKENESVSVAPHDPFKPEQPVQQDPKIVRETSPQSNIVFNFIKSVTADINQCGNSVETSMANPSTVVDPGAGVMGKARETSDKVKNDTPVSDTVVTPPPKPKNEKPEAWNPDK
ncbi:hypothetical protein HGH92_03780 [Chitinophaga varians]|uniref:Uncharacterized protein n=1 Tax=Chitinophaga varians TaxID=2202339 RepID=A0A847RRI1_9BACT|nr:hypothetical protein [Chitinophaga varians]NLR63417.1 hypothetical protein [Chitinophaga varians]